MPPVSVPVPGGGAGFDAGEQATATTTMVISTFTYPKQPPTSGTSTYYGEVPELVRRFRHDRRWLLVIARPQTPSLANPPARLPYSASNARSHGLQVLLMVTSPRRSHCDGGSTRHTW